MFPCRAFSFHRSFALAAVTAAAALAAALPLAARDAVEAGTDRLTLVNNTSHEGNFKAYKGGRFIFKTNDGKDIQEMRSRVASLDLDPPSLVTVRLQGKKREDLKLRSYAAGTFTFEGNGRTTKAPAGAVASIDLEMDFRRPEIDTVSTVAPADGGNLAVEKRVATGVVTVVHFHMGSVMASVRQGGYVDSVAQQSKGKVVVVRIEIPRLDSPAAAKYGITAAPQFWIYNREAELVRKLVGRFTDQELDKALQEAGRQP